MPREAYFGLPPQVVFCTKCVMSNQRPNSEVEFRHTAATRKTTLHMDDEGVCDACRYAEAKEQIDWTLREQELLKLLDRHRRDDGEYDCVVPGSGGKDSAFTAHLLKYKYGMHPLTVTWPPILYTDYGWRNFNNWVDVGGFDNVSFKRNGRVMKLLTKLSILNLLHPFQTFMIGQKNVAPKIALKYKIPLIFYGENQAEYGNPIADNTSSMMKKSFYTYSNLGELSLGGVPVKELREKYKLSLNDISCFLPPTEAELKVTPIEFHYLGYYVKWVPQEAYYYAVENTAFQARPNRSQGTYSKYNSIDDKIDDLHFYTYYIKFGLGRATYDAAQEIRNRHITREEGVNLVRRFDGEFPDKYFSEILEYLDLTATEFWEACDRFRSPHLWGKDEHGEWRLRHTVWKGGLDD